MRGCLALGKKAGQNEETRENYLKNPVTLYKRLNNHRIYDTSIRPTLMGLFCLQCVAKVIVKINLQKLFFTYSIFSVAGDYDKQYI